MKFTVMFKCPDALDCAIENAIPLEDFKNIEDRYEREDKIKAIKKQFAKFFSYGEYVDIECDTEKGTAVVLSHQ